MWFHGRSDYCFVYFFHFALQQSDLAFILLIFALCNCINLGHLLNKFSVFHWCGWWHIDQLVVENLVKRVTLLLKESTWRRFRWILIVSNFLHLKLVHNAIHMLLQVNVTICTDRLFQRRFIKFTANACYQCKCSMFALVNDLLINWELVS